MLHAWVLLNSVSGNRVQGWQYGLLRQVPSRKRLFDPQTARWVTRVCAATTSWRVHRAGGCNARWCQKRKQARNDCVCAVKVFGCSHFFPALRKNLISSLVLSRFCFNAHVVGNSSCFYVVVCDQFSCSLFMCVTVPFSVYDVSRTHVFVFMRTLLTDVTHPCIWCGSRSQETGHCTSTCRSVA